MQCGCGCFLPTKGLLRISSTQRVEFVFKASSKRRAPSLERPHFCRSTAVQQATKKKRTNLAEFLQNKHKILVSLYFYLLTFNPEVLCQFICKSSSTPVPNQSVTVQGDAAETCHSLKLWLSIPQRFCPCGTMPLHSLMLKRKL